MGKYLLTAIMLFASIPFVAQNRYTIEGEVKKDTLRNGKQPLTMVYLSRIEGNRPVCIDSAKVENHRFTFEGEAPAIVDKYRITGFDNGAVELFLEPGTIQIRIPDAAFPGGGTVTGTANNDMMNELKSLLYGSYYTSASQKMQEVLDKIPADQRDNQETVYAYQNAQFNNNTAMGAIGILNLTLKNMDKEASLYLLRDYVVEVFSPSVYESKILPAIPLSLRKHPVYKEIWNNVKAKNMKVGNDVPDFTAITLDGKELSLSDLQGKYVLLDFWASWCGPCRKEIPYVKKALEAAKGSGKFVVLSYSVDTKRTDWEKAIEENAMKMDDWYHVADLNGWNSSVPTLFGVQSIPRTFLLNPSGKLITTDLRGDDLVHKIENILSGAEKFE